MRLIWLPVSVVFCALSFVRNVRREDRYKNTLGFLDPSMDQHWRRLFAERDRHSAKNVLVEWTRLDPQRAAKAFSFALVVSIFVNLIQGLL